MLQVAFGLRTGATYCMKIRSVMGWFVEVVKRGECNSMPQIASGLRPGAILHEDQVSQGLARRDRWMGGVLSQHIRESFILF